LKAVTSGLFRALKTLAPSEVIRLHGRIKAANKGEILSVPGQNIRGGWGDRGPEPEVAEDLLAHRRPGHKKTVNHWLAVFE
jgi:hypothetical protein